MRRLVLASLLALGFAMPAPAATAPEPRANPANTAIAWGAVAQASGSDWVLMGREGGCVSLRDAAQRREEFRGVSRPQELVETLRRRGQEVEISETPLGDAAMVEVTAPGVGLAVIFVPRKLCRSFR